MAVPTYEGFMVPVLRILADGQVRTSRQVRREAADLLGLSEEDRAPLIPSGTQMLYDNRAQWASTYLFKAGLVDRPARGRYVITDAGRQFLASHPDTLSTADLMAVPQFREWNQSSRQSPAAPKPAAGADGATVAESLSPEEAIGDVLQRINRGLAQELIGRIYTAAGGEGGDGRLLEEVSLRLLRAMGYGGRGTWADVVGGSGDAGLDVIIHQDALGLDLVGVQAKCYEPSKTIGRPVIQSFVGALQGAQTQRGVFITTARFSREARQYAENVPVRLVLIDGPELADLLLQHNIGVMVRRTYHLKEIDESFFAE